MFMRTCIVGTIMFQVKILQHVRDNDPDDDRNVIHFM